MIQQIFKDSYPRYLESFRPHAQQSKAALGIIRCRTAELGGHTSRCDRCGHQRVHYNSCRNRHCPLCQGVKKAVWIDRRRADVLEAPYFHLVFTVPKELCSLIYQNQELLYDLMYKAAARTILELCQDKRYLGARPGFFSLLHTWAQDLHYHPHLHTVVLAGGLTPEGKWQEAGEKFFIPVKVLGAMFRGKFLHHLKEHYQAGRLGFYGQAAGLKDPAVFKALVDKCYHHDWYTYAKRPFSGPMAVIKYLGNYTHRIAISGSRIVKVHDGRVTITLKDRKSGRLKEAVMEEVEFIRRFLMHVLPQGFVKVRHYGILANRNKKASLALCRQLTGSFRYVPRFAGLSTVQVMSRLAGRDMTLCPVCQEGKMQAVAAAPGPVP